MSSIAATLIAALTFATSPILAQSNGFEWTGRLELGQTIEIQGLEGEIRADLAPDDEAEILARKAGDESDFDQVERRMVENKGGVTVCAVYSWWRAPSPAVWRRRNYDHASMPRR